jgi:hypothetical protein
MSDIKLGCKHIEGVKFGGAGTHTAICYLFTMLIEYQERLLTCEDRITKIESLEKERQESYLR